MKPYDGGQWVGVTRIKRQRASCTAAYDESGERLMHLQASVEGFDVFARSLSIGAETMVMDFRPDQPMHDRYAVVARLPRRPETGDEVAHDRRLINAFFRWEFNSCETLVRGAEAHPIDYANASPDVALTSPALLLPVGDERAAEVVRSSASSPAATPRLDLDTRRYFEIGDREDLTYAREARRVPRAGRRVLRGRALPRVLRQPRSPHVDELVLDWVASAEFDRLLVETVRATYPPHEHEQFLAHFRGLHRPVGARARRRRSGRSRPELERPLDQRRPPRLDEHDHAVARVQRVGLVREAHVAVADHRADHRARRG